MSLSVAAFLWRAEGSMSARTGNYGRKVECRVPEMRCKVEFNCTSTNPVWGDCDQTGAQYSATESQRAMADVWRVSALAPQLEPTSFISRLSLFFSFPQFLSDVL